MVTIYHGGSDIITKPEIRVPNRTLDFGAGFYLTSSREQAENWVRRRFGNTEEAKRGYVNHYSFLMSEASKTLRIKVFDSANDEWLDFVMTNRKERNYSHDYDVVVGPVANDRVYTAFALYESGTIGRDTLIQELKTYRLVDQYLFHTSAALEYLKFIDVTEIAL